MSKTKQITVTRVRPPVRVVEQKTRYESKYVDVLRGLDTCAVGDWLKAENITNLLKFRNAVHQYAFRKGMRVNVVHDPENAGVVFVLNVGPRAVPPALRALPQDAMPQAV